MITQFTAKISKMGKQLIIIIPQEFHNDVNTNLGKQIKVKLDKN